VVRFAVVGGVVGTLAGCTSSSNDKPVPPSPGGPEDPDRELRAQVGADQGRLTALYAAADVPSRAMKTVTELGARHLAYGQAINPVKPSATPSGASPSGATSSGSAVPQAPVTALGLKGLRKAELASSATLIAQANKAVDPDLARLLVLAAAGSAAAAESLRMVANG
jgi:hypothetical protein